jgi:hypothetical protein
MVNLERHNWKAWRYVDLKSGKHTDPYVVLVLEPIDPSKTSPTYDDVFMFLENLLDVEKLNDDSLQRAPQLPSKIGRLKRLIEKFEGGKQSEMLKVEDFM